MCEQNYLTKYKLDIEGVLFCRSVIYKLEYYKLLPQCRSEGRRD